MSDVILEIWRGGVPGELKVFVKVGDDEHEITCPEFSLDVVLANQLLSGEPPNGVHAQVAAKVSTWLLKGDVSKHLLKALDGPRFRLAVRLADDLASTSLAEVPFELLEQPVDDYFVFKPTVRSMVHLLKKVAGAPNPAAGRSWPLRIAVVRSNPKELGEAVPPAAPLRDHIAARAKQHHGDGAVEVTLLSSEAGDPPVTWDRVAAHLRGDSPPDVLVYLGHSDLPEGFEQVRGGKLQLEADGDDAAVPLSFVELRSAMARVPVVVLAGCLTAAKLADKPELRELVPNWMRANQGLAQALVNSSSGVQIAVGMRYRLEAFDAILFLKEFFTSLLALTPGDVEAAVAWGRVKLLDRGAHPPRWSAPVVFRRQADEPTFPFLATPLAPKIKDEDGIQTARELAWGMLKKFPLGGGQGGLQPVLDGLAEVETTYLHRAGEAGVPVIKASRVHAGDGDKRTVTVSLHGPLAVLELRGRVVISDPSFTIADCAPAAQLRTAGMRGIVGTAEPGVVDFDIRPVLQPGLQTGQKPLPEGELFTFSVALGAALPAVHTMRVEIEQVLPRRPVLGGLDAVVVVPP